MEPCSAASNLITLRPGEAYRTDIGLLARSPKTGEILLFVGFSDIDGTINDEHVPESKRIHTITPAVEAVRELQALGIPVGICTARAEGEAQMYAKAVGARGSVISENGACTTYPLGDRVTIGDMREIRECVAMIEAKIGRSVTSTIDLPRLEAVWREQCAARGSRGQSSLAPYNDDLGHDSLEALRLSAARGASAYLAGLTPHERSIAIAVAESQGFKPFGDLLHLISRRANKGVALEALCERLRGERVAVTSGSFTIGAVTIDRVAPIVFGNGENDLPLFSAAIERGGYGILVADPIKPSGFHFDICSNPPHPKTLRTEGAPFGHGMKASIPLLCEQLQRDYGVELQR